ncbi:MAG: SPOR domain-containing protein [Pseudomonadota bacterium]
MANYYYESDYESYDDGAAGEMATLANWAGAAISFALMVGLGIWGYQLLVRDVTGVPVVRALEGPMRIAPENPGGLQAEHQGLSVTHVAVEGTSERPAERVVLAPAPLELSDEDQPLAQLESITADPVASEPEGVAIVPLANPDPAPVAQPVLPEPEPKSAIELAIAEALAATEPVSETTPAPTPEPAVQIIPASVEGVSQSPRPPARSFPPQAQAQVINAVAVASNPTGELDVDPATIPAGTRLVQLGAFPSADEARTAWDGLSGQFGDFLAGKGRVVQEASAGGTTFYRLRATGFEDLSDARRFCAVLVADNANCIPVIRR